MGISAVEALRGSLPSLFGSPLRRIVPEREDSGEAISNERVDVYIKPQTAVVASMTITTFDKAPRSFGLILSELTKVMANPNAEEPTSITVKDPYNGQEVTIFQDRVTSRRIDVRV